MKSEPILLRDILLKVMSDIRGRMDKQRRKIPGRSPARAPRPRAITGSSAETQGDHWLERRDPGRSPARAHKAKVRR